MRNMSFALTTEQIRAQIKTVTRRLGWKDLKPGTLLQPVVKGQGIPKGQQVEKIGGQIRVVAVRREPLFAMTDGKFYGTCEQAYGLSEVAREGFTEMSPADFVAMFCDHNTCTRETVVTRIEFEYVESVNV